MQKIMFIGNLGKDPEMRYQPNGKAVTSFSVAVNEDYTNAMGEKVKKTIWFRVTTWDKKAEVCNQYLHKGSKVYVEGRITVDPATGGPRIWAGQDGIARANTEVSAIQVEFLSSKAENEVLAAKSGEPVVQTQQSIVAKSNPYDSEILPIEEDGLAF
jgi:single-strand DNA-binding protein